MLKNVFIGLFYTLDVFKLVVGNLTSFTAKYFIFKSIDKILQSAITFNGFLLKKKIQKKNISKAIKRPKITHRSPSMGVPRTTFREESSGFCRELRKS